MKATTIPSPEQIKQFDDAVQSTPQLVIALARIAAERNAATLAAKAASTRRELARATAAKVDRKRVEQLRALAASYSERAGQGAEHLKMAMTLEKIGVAYGQRPAAYGRAVDERGRGHANLPVALATEQGETLAEGRTDEDGYFALSAALPTDATGEVVLRVGEGGSLGTFAVTSRGRLIPPREIRVSGPRGGRVTKTSHPDGPPKKD